MVARKSANATPKAKIPNASILSFFKKEPVEEPFFVPSRSSPIVLAASQDTSDIWENSVSKRRKISFEGTKANPIAIDIVNGECTPPPPEPTKSSGQSRGSRKKSDDSAHATRNVQNPFEDDSDSENEAETSDSTPITPTDSQPLTSTAGPYGTLTKDTLSINPNVKAPSDLEDMDQNDAENIPSSGDFEDFEGIGDLEEDSVPEEQMENDEWMERQKFLELEVQESVSCPICNKSLADLTEDAIGFHVNECLDHHAALEVQQEQDRESPEIKMEQDRKSPEVKMEPETKNQDIRKRMFVPRPAKPGQKDPLTSTPSIVDASAFSKLMSKNAEDTAWKTAAAREVASRGKQAYERTCPFYKIMPGTPITVDAFRYGAVEGCQAYFLSHFHSDHYIGLTGRWCHGPIYCSKVTANLVLQQLKVDPKWVVALDWEKETAVPNTGVNVTMISANHCPGSSLFLFERPLGNANSGKKHRILHCGDFRACREHLEHPLLRPNVQDAITGQSRQQRIDVCYLDTTYLNPKYAFPSQVNVIQACQEMVTKLNKTGPLDSTSGNADNQMKSFIKSGSKKGNTKSDSESISENKPPRLLVVVGTYSIGKERICIGIAKALKSKIFAPPAKMRICSCLEDPELNDLLTSDPRKAQVHMTPVFEIRAETLDEYLCGYLDTFTHVVGFRPTGWTYRPPNSRFIESPAVSTVLNGENWGNGYGIKDMAPQRGSTKRATCFGVPYSEHSSFRELTMFCCALRIDKIVPTVNVGSAKSREKMRTWVERWSIERKKNGLFDPKHF